MPLAERIKLCLDLARIKLTTTIDYLDSYAYLGIVYPYLTNPEPSGFNFFNWLLLSPVGFQYLWLALS